MVKLDIHPSLLLSPACNRTIAYYSMYMYVTKAYNNGNEDMKDGWMFSFTVVLCYKWVKIGRMDGCLVLL
jgi:hypothetical protein